MKSIHYLFLLTLLFNISSQTSAQQVNIDFLTIKNETLTLVEKGTEVPIPQFILDDFSGCKIDANGDIVCDHTQIAPNIFPVSPNKCNLNKYQDNLSNILSSKIIDLLSKSKEQINEYINNLPNCPSARFIYQVSVYSQLTKK